MAPAERRLRCFQSSAAEMRIRRGALRALSLSLSLSLSLCLSLCLCLCALPPTRGAVVPLPGGEPNCSPEEYKPEGLAHCCKHCPAGSHVSRHCGVNHGDPMCSPCGHGGFLAHPNGKTSCQPCSQCRADQEVVSVCTQTRDRRCQCKTGSFYCDSAADCVENCFRCLRCPGAVLRPCNATHDTVCDTGAGTEAPGKTPRGVPDPGNVLVVTIALVVAVVVLVCISGFLGFRIYRKKGVWLRQRVLRFWKGRADGPDSTACPQHSESLLPLGAENQGPATDVDTASSGGQLEEGSALTAEAGPAPGPTEEPAEGTERQQGAVVGSPAAPQQALRTAAAAAPGLPSLRSLEREYEAMYFVNDTSNEARLYYEFESKISRRH